MNTITLTENKQFKDYLATVRHHYNNGLPYGSTEMHFKILNMYAMQKDRINDPNQVVMDEKAQHHITNMAGILGTILGKPDASYENLTVEDARNLANCIGERRNGITDPYPVRGNNITEANYRGVLGHIALTIAADLVGDRQRTMKNDNVVNEFVPLGITTLSGEPIYFDSKAVMPDVMAKPEKPKKPNIFKRAIHALNSSAFKDEFDDYNAKYDTYKKEINFYKENAHYQQEANDRAPKREKEASEISNNVMKLRSLRAEITAQDTQLSFKDLIDSDIQILHSADLKQTQPVKTKTMNNPELGGKSK